MGLKKNLKLSSLMLLATGVVACSDSDKFNFDAPPVVVNPPPAVEVKTETDSAEDVNGSTGAMAVVNVLANDTIDGEAATTTNVDLQEVTADAEGVLTLSAEGNVDVSANSVAGNYSLEYQICEKGTSNCATATATVSVVTIEILAADDVAENANGTNGETAVVNVLDNDTFGGAAVVIDAIDLSEVTPDPSGSLTLNADGTVDLASGTANGDYQLTYQICEKGTENCAQATATVTVDMMTGVFMKGMGQGVAFETDSMSGMTNDLGAYSYLAGENITFSIGATVLGETVEAKAELDITDLVPGVQMPEDVVGTKQLTNDLWRNYGNDGDERRKQFELINMMSLLFSVDKDKNSANGIQVDPKMHEAFANKSYSFKERVYDFKSQYRLQRNLFDAYNNSAVDNARIIHFAKSIDLLYQYLGLETLVYSQKAYSQDQNGDGTFEYTGTWSFDSNLMLSSRTWDSPTNSQTYTYSYNEFGQLEAYSTSNNYSSETSFNIHGQRTEHFWDNNNDGVAERSYIYEYDVHGNLIKQQDDNNGDGVIDYIYSYEYDENSNQIKQVIDNNADGVADSISLSEFDDNGNRTSYSDDYDADGTPDNINYFSYDAQGNMTSDSHDSGADGIIEMIYLYEYDARGNLILQTYDEDGDGIADRIYRSEYDANNNRTFVEGDTNGDGVMDYMHQYEYDANGNQTSYKYDNNADGTIDSISTREFDANQALTLVASDNNNDGTIDSKQIYENDSNGARVKYTRDDNNDGTINHVTDYVNDSFGNRLTMTQDNNADGTIDYYYEYEYQQTNFTSVYQYH